MAEVKKQVNIPKAVEASARGLHLAPRKMRLVTNLVKNMRASDAITQLQFTNKKGAPMIAKLIKSALANAENNFSLNAEDMFVKSITCDMGQTMKRYFPRARGSAFTIRRKMSHVTLVLEERKISGKKKSRFAIVRKAKSEETSATKEPENEIQPSVKNISSKPDVPKASELRKSNQIQQKRRLFNRKSGE